MRPLPAVPAFALVLALGAGLPGATASAGQVGRHSAFCAALGGAVARVVRPWVVAGERGSGHKAVGVAVGLYQGGRECYFGFGTTRFVSGGAPTRNTLFEIGALTETFTATMLALHEVQDPAFSARSPVNIRGIPCSRRVCLRLGNGMEQLTYRELATFTGGVPDDPGGLPGPGMRHDTQADFLGYLDGLSAPPGGLPTAVRHSISSYGFLGQLLMSLGGYHDFNDPRAFRASFDEWIGRSITGPLAMTCTAADVASLPTACHAGSELATGYDYRHGRYVPVDEPWPWLPSGAADALRSDTEDLVHYLAAYVGASDASGVRVPRALAQAMERARNPVGVPPGGRSGRRQAYAWVVVDASQPRRSIVYTGGDTAGFSACLALAPAAGAGVVLLVNAGRARPCVRARKLLQRTLPGRAAGSRP